MQRYDEALADLNRAIELNPSLPYAITGRGNTYWRMRRYGKALADLRLALRTPPSVTGLPRSSGRPVNRPLTNVPHGRQRRTAR
jgi:hypothetical protein